MVNKPRRFAVGDIHANHKLLKQVFKESNFNYEEDLLIIIGDVVDGYCGAYECVEELIKVKNKVFIIGNHDCISNDTEVLTENGWKTIKNINNELVANFDITTGNITYDKPIAKIPLHKNNGIIIEAYNTKQHITPNHNIVIDNKKIRASTIVKNKINTTRFRQHGNINNKGINYSDDYIRYLTWIVTDGCMYSETKNKKRIQFKLSKQKKIDRLKSILNNLNIKYTFKKATKSGLNKLQPYMIRIYGDEARNIFKLIGDVKNFPLNFKNFSKKQANIFLKELVMTDGYTDVWGKTVIITINKQDADLIQIIMITNGISCSITKYENHKSGFPNGKTQYGITIYNKTAQRQYSKCTITTNKQFSCLTMPKGTLITRLDGKIAFTGNCWFMDHIANGWSDFLWTSQGGDNTIKSYKYNGYDYKKMPESHKDFFNSGVYYYELDEMMFVHGGFEYPTLPKDSTPKVLTWDRSLIARCRNRLKLREWKKVFVGHTTTENEGAKPITYKKDGSADFIQIDCGAGWLGRLCLYNIDTDEYFLSDYADSKDRHKFDEVYNG